MRGCKGCNNKALVKGITGAWFLMWFGESTYQVAYCPFCGTLLDSMVAEEPRRVKALHVHLADQSRAKRKAKP